MSKVGSCSVPRVFRVESVRTENFLPLSLLSWQNCAHPIQPSTADEIAFEFSRASECVRELALGEEGWKLLRGTFLGLSGRRVGKKRVVR